MRLAQLDPDYRKDPTSDFYCCRCQKSLNGKKHRWVYLQDGFNIIHPDDVQGLDNSIEPEPIGINCAKQVGLEFSFIINSTKGIR